jgi:hypothetical protein
MSEGRQHPRHPWSKVFQALFLGAACQMRSLREIELACRSGCLKRRVEISGDEMRRWRWQYYHRVVLAVVVSGPFPVPVALRLQQPGESEAACAAALPEELVHYLGRRYFDIVVPDATSPLRLARPPLRHPTRMPRPRARASSRSTPWAGLRSTPA